MITKSYLIQNKGITAEFHVIKEVQSFAPFNACVVSVHSFANEAAYLAGSILLYNTTVNVPVDNIDGALLDHIEFWLVTSDESPFSGGTIVPDNSQSVEAVKTRAWAAIKAAREQAENGSFVYDGGSYQADKVRIMGAVQLATLAKAAGVPFSETWTLTDNTTRTLDADQVIGLGLALGSYVSGIYATGRALREQIKAAATIDEVSAVGWPA